MKRHRLCGVLLALVTTSSTAHAAPKSVNLEAGASRRMLLGRAVSALEIDVGPTALKREWFTLRVPFRATYGQTHQGLHVLAARVAFQFELRWERFHVGVDAGGLVVGFVRATDGYPVLAPGVGSGVSTRFDFLRTANGPVFIALHGDAAWAQRVFDGASRGGAWTGYGASLGFDFDLGPHSMP